MRGKSGGVAGGRVEKMGRGRQKPVARDPPGPLTLTSRERGDTDEGTAAGNDVPR